MKKKRGNKHSVMRTQKAIRTDPRLNSPLHRELLKLRVIPTEILNHTIPFLAKWDLRLGFKLIRILMLLVPTVVAIAAYLIKSVFGTSLGLSSIFSVYVSLNQWIAVHGLGWVLPLTALFAFVPPVEGLINSDTPLGKKVTLSLVYQTSKDLFTLFLSIKYLSFQPALYTVWFLLTVSTYWLMFKLHDYQKERGEFSPDKLLKEVRRRELRGQ